MITKFLKSRQTKRQKEKDLFEAKLFFFRLGLHHIDNQLFIVISIQFYNINFGFDFPLFWGNNRKGPLMILASQTSVMQVACFAKI